MARKNTSFRTNNHKPGEIDPMCLAKDGALNCTGAATVALREIPTDSGPKFIAGYCVEHADQAK